MNNYTEEEHAALLALPASYSIIGKEVGEEGTPHLQAYFNFGRNNRHRLSSVKKYSDRGHWEVAKGSDQQNKVYCSKGNDFIEQGSIQQSGKRNDLQNICDGIKSKRKWSELVDENPTAIVKYSRGLDNLRQMYITRRDFKTKVLVCVGPPGIGKSRWAHENYPDAFWKPNGIWWDGYDGQETVICDDFECDLPYSMFLKVCDRYPCQVPIKGGMKEFVSKTIIFISNKTVDTWYTDSKYYQRQAVLRRIDNHIDVAPPIDITK